MHRLSLAILAGIAVASCAWLPSLSCAQNAASERPTALQAPSRSTADAFIAQDATGIGLRPPGASLRERINLPFGLNYSREAKSLLMQLDEKNEWGLGLNLNVNATPAVDLAPPGLYIAPRRTPGLMLLRSF
jgi:hypothetical protein